jgi:hypothetical protein
MNNNVLNEIILRSQDISEPFGDFHLPPQVHRLDFRECRFTAGSLRSLFLNLSKRTSAITLGFADLRIAEGGWETFF